MASEQTNDRLRKLAALKKLPEFAWFLETYVKPAHEAADKKLKALATVSAERDNAAHVADALKKVLDAVDDDWAHYSAAEQRGE